MFTRWYFDPESDSCKTFTFYGCKGNKNNFPSEEKCLDVCGPERSGLDSYDEENKEFGGGESQSNNHNGWSASSNNINEDSTYAEKRRPCKWAFVNNNNNDNLFLKFLK